MCLDTVDKETKQVTEGWKIFEVTENSSLLYGMYRLCTFRTNEWLKDPEDLYIPTLSNDKKYPTGFHFYFDKDIAELEVEIASKLFDGTIFNKREFKIFKVKVKNIVATGKERKHKVGVAREIFIEEESC